MTIPLPWIILPILGLMLYWPCLAGELIYDDLDLADNWQKPWVWWGARPLTTLIYRLTHLWPGTLRAHHVTNVLIHALNAVLVGKIAASIGVSPWIASLIFLSHPFAVNATAYISGLASLLSTTFGLLSTCLILTEHPYWSVLFLGASIAAKQDGVGFILTASLLLLRTGQTSPIEWIGFALIGIPAFFFCLQHYDPESEAKHHIHDGLPGPLPHPEHAMTVLIHTLRRLPAWALGFVICPKHGGGIETTFDDEVGAFLGLAVLAFLSIGYPVPLIFMLAGPWLVYVFYRVHEPLAEYRNYGMVSGFALLLASIPLAAILVLGWFSYRSFFLAGTYRTAESFWRAATRSGLGDKSLAWHNLGGHYMHNRKWEEAEQASKWAVALNPRLAPARKNLAWTLVELGRKEEGIFQMEKGIISRPDFAPLWEDLALLYQSEGNLAEADKAILRAMTLKPESAPILNRAGIIAYLRQQHREAKEWFLDAIQIDPSPVYRFNLAITQKQLGEKPDIVGMPRNLKLTSDVIPPQIREVPC